LTNIPENILVEKVVNSIRDNVVFDGYEVKLVNPLGLALELLRKGYSSKLVSNYLDWRDFEKFAGEILSKHGYQVYLNFKSFKPVRFEIDVIGVDPASGRGLFIDCKHWNKGLSRSTLTTIIDKHVERINKFTKYFSWYVNKWIYFKYLKEVIPVVITLTTPVIRVYNNTIVVSIQEFNQFLIDIYYAVESLGVISFKVK